MYSVGKSEAVKNNEFIGLLTFIYASFLANFHLGLWPIFLNALIIFKIGCLPVLLMLIFFTPSAISGVATPFSITLHFL